MSDEATRRVSDDQGGGATTSESDSEDDVLIESLVAGRSKRATAGNLLSSLLAKEGASVEKAGDDDDLQLLFAENEEEEDVEFEGDEGEDGSDVQLESSSDDDDQGPTVGADDLEGEKELEKKEREERRKKRKAQEIYKRPRALKKKIKVDPTTAESTIVTPVSRPKKKSERISWLPTPDEGPVRSSSRKQTVQNKEVVHQRMQANEKRRRQQIVVMEAAAKRKEASKLKTMTQADRMAEAARTEKKNAKSLNKWEETEKKRLDEQKARLAALHSRQLNGPVLSWWSGPSKWVDGKLVAVGARKMVDEKKDIIPVQGLVEDITPQPILQSPSVPPPPPPPPPAAVRSPPVLLPLPSTNVPTNTEADTIMSHDPPVVSNAAPVVPSIAPSQDIPKAPTSSYLSHIEIPPRSSTAQVYEVPSPLDSMQHNASMPPNDQQNMPLPRMPMYHSNHYIPIAPPPPPVTEVSTRNLVILENIDGNTNRVPELQNHVLLRKKNAKLQKATPEICAITGHAAKFRDPKTGLAYANSYAYNEIQKLRNGAARWSDLLGCYVGSVANAARGVPENFHHTSGAA